MKIQKLLLLFAACSFGFAQAAGDRWGYGSDDVAAEEEMPSDSYYDGSAEGSPEEEDDRWSESRSSSDALLSDSMDLGPEAQAYDMTGEGDYATGQSDEMSGSYDDENGYTDQAADLDPALVNQVTDGGFVPDDFVSDEAMDSSGDIGWTGAEQEGDISDMSYGSEYPQNEQLDESLFADYTSE
jgi:hypothetical protein